MGSNYFYQGGKQSIYREELHRGTLRFGNAGAASGFPNSCHGMWGNVVKNCRCALDAP